MAQMTRGQWIAWLNERLWAYTRDETKPADVRFASYMSLADLRQEYRGEG